MNIDSDPIGSSPAGAGSGSYNEAAQDTIVPLHSDQHRPHSSNTSSSARSSNVDRLHLSPTKSKDADDDTAPTKTVKKAMKSCSAGSFKKSKTKTRTSKDKSYVGNKCRSQSPSSSPMNLSIKRSSSVKKSTLTSKQFSGRNTAQNSPHDRHFIRTNSSPRPSSPPQSSKTTHPCSLKSLRQQYNSAAAPATTPGRPASPPPHSLRSSSSRRTPQRSQSSPGSSAQKSTLSLRQRMHMSAMFPDSLPLVDSPVAARLTRSDHKDDSSSSQQEQQQEQQAISMSSSPFGTQSMLEQLPSNSNSSSSTRHRGNSNSNSNDDDDDNNNVNINSISIDSLNDKSSTNINYNGHLSSSSVTSFAFVGQHHEQRGHENSSGSMSFLGAIIDSSSALSNAATPTATRASSSVIPTLYRCARKGYWDEVSSAIDDVSTNELAFQYKKDGTTVLHLAVMSRTGYIDSFRSKAGGIKRSKSSERRTDASATTSTSETFNNEGKQQVTKYEQSNIAPLSVIEDLLRISPKLAEIRCTLNGYTPLTYACLVCNEDYDTDDGAAMVRLFLKYCPASINVFSREGLSPVDAHIVSYSHHHKNKEDVTARGKTSTSVLRTLLHHSPHLANLRCKGDKIEGPIELLYKCNASAFSKAVMDEVYNSDDDGTVRSDYTIPERRQKVVDTVTKWWIWTWAVMILKYGSLTKNKKKGSRFAAVHTASMQVGVPTPILSITLYAFPRQIKQPIELADESGNLPLHAVCSWPCHTGCQTVATNEGDAMVPIRKSMAINRVLDEYPNAVKVSNKRGETALELAVASRTTWDGGVKRLVKANPKALKVQSPITGLYPFMTAATVVAITSTNTNTDVNGEAEGLSIPDNVPTKRQDLHCLRTIYGLLRSNPKVLIQCYDHQDKLIKY